MKPIILLYKVPSAKANAIRPAAAMIGAAVMIADDSMLGTPVGAIVYPDMFPNDNGAMEAVSDHSEEFMLLCGFDKKMLDKLLNFLKKKKLGVSLKAMLTETNKDWTLDKLITEITAERAQIAEAIRKK